MRVTNLAIIIIPVTLAYALIWPLTCQATPGLTVAVSILPEKYFITRLAGDGVNVIVMAGKGHNPETYEPKPKQLTELKQAQLYFLVGVPLEQKWSRIFREVNPSMKMISLVDGINQRKMERNILSSGLGNSQTLPTGDAFDPHFWLNPQLVKLAAKKITSALIANAPNSRQYYENNYNHFIQDLDLLDSSIRNYLASAKQRTFIVVHPSWGYFADEYHLTQIPVEFEGKQPGAKAMAALVSLARQKQIKVIFIQPQFSDRNAETLAREIGAKLVTVDPLAEDYISSLNQVAKSLAESLL